jgi:hypothetical protein
MDYADDLIKIAKQAGNLSQAGTRANYLNNMQKRKAEDRQLDSM